MLVSKSNFAVEDIVSFKLVNGDEVVAEISSINDFGYVLRRPCLVMPSPQGLGLIQALFSADTDKLVDLKNQHIMMMAPTLDQMKKHYMQTTTGIQTVTAGSKIIT
jgi:hypothetical protein